MKLKASKLKSSTSWNKPQARIFLYTLALSLLLVAPVKAQFGKPPGPPKAKVSMKANVDAIVPGQSFDVALAFEIKEGWHIYWQNPGDVGIAPKATWKLPAGFTASELKYPVPKRHADGGGLFSFILEDKPILQTTITAPTAIDTDTITLAADLKYLICEKTCIQEKTKVSIELPVARPGSEPKSANLDLFKRMHQAQPSQHSKYVAIKASVSTEKLEQDTKFEVVLDVDVSKKHHIQCNAPLSDALIRSEVFVHRVAGIDFEKPVFPKAKIRDDAAFGKLSEYAGHFQVRIPGEAYERLESNPIELSGLFQFQCCSDKGNCFPPETMTFTTRVASDGPTLTKNLAATITDTPASNPASGSMADGQTEDAAITTPVNVDGEQASKSIWYWLGLAFLGGLILNVMPCVLPVISIKVLSFVQQADEDAWRVRRLGIAFCAGIVISFWALAAVIILLKSWGNQLGWGFQFQSPVFVMVMMALMFVFGLSLLGVFTISLPGRATTNLAAAEQREGYTGAFMKGVLGMILATPCTAPFLGPALGVAFTSSSIELFAIFTSVSFGMASPFFLLTMYPAWLKYLPRPGAWMENFKQLMGFMLMGTVVWLLWILSKQIGADGLIWTLVLLVALALACWLIGKITPSTSGTRQAFAWVTAIAIVFGTWWYSFERSQTVGNLIAQVRLANAGNCCEDVTQIQTDDWDKHIPWQRWSKGLPEELAEQGYTVYVDYTASWCATCLANKKATLEGKMVRSKMRDNCIIPLKADFTLEDPDILEDLNKFHRSGVPLNVIYAAGNHTPPIVMPEQLVGRTSLVLEKLDAAGPSQICSTAEIMTPIQDPDELVRMTSEN